MKEMFFAVVVTVFGVVNILLVNVQAKKIDEVFERTRILNKNLDMLYNEVRDLSYNPAVQKGKREAEIQRFKYELKKLEEERDNDYVEVDYEN